MSMRGHHRDPPVTTACQNRPQAYRFRTDRSPRPQPDCDRGVEDTLWLRLTTLLRRHLDMSARTISRTCADDEPTISLRGTIRPSAVTGERQSRSRAIAPGTAEVGVRGLLLAFYLVQRRAGAAEYEHNDPGELRPHTGARAICDDARRSRCSELYLGSNRKPIPASVWMYDLRAPSRGSILPRRRAMWVRSTWVSSA